MNDKVPVEMTPLAQVDDGLYEVKLIQAVRGARRYDRNDLVMEFEIVQEQEQGVVLPAYYQVRWIDDAAFTAGQKSHYFRDYQACIGSMNGKFFTLEDFQDGRTRPGYNELSETPSGGRGRRFKSSHPDH